MAHVVTSKCNKCKFTDCVAVCPVSCFYELENQLVIFDDECIDCTACVAECPVQAITPPGATVRAPLNVPLDQTRVCWPVLLPTVSE